jgi:lysyl-tRNA synthetase class 1
VIENYNVFENKIEDDEKKALKEMLIELKLINKDIENSNENIENVDLSQKIQTLIFVKSKENKIEPKNFFKLIYRILINSERGPKLGNYIVDLGIKNVIALLEKNIT